MREQIRSEVFDYGLAPGETFEPVEEPGEPFDLARPHVMTVLGPIEPAALGVTLTHEHLLANPVAANDPDLVLDDRHAALAELDDFYAAGGRAVVEMSPIDYGRDIRGLRWIAERAMVHIVAVTGHHKALFAAPYVAGRDVDEVAREIVRELVEGVAGTGVRAGAIKAGTSLDTITSEEEIALRAAARAHLATGAPITTHTEQGTMAHEQLAILREEGVDPARVILGHLERRLEEDLLRSVLETGAFVAFDQISKTRYGTDEARAAMVKRLVGGGYAGQLLLSGDLARKSALRSYGGEPGLAGLLERFPLTLMEAGVDAPTIRRLLVENPARALAIRR